MTEVFLCETGQLTAASRKALKAAGIIVAEVADLDRCRFVRAGEIISGDDLLWAALEALRHREYGGSGKGDWQRGRFADNVAAIMMAAHQPPLPPKEGG
jgi:hypothetical protein